MLYISKLTQCLTLAFNAYVAYFRVSAHTRQGGNHTCTFCIYFLGVSSVKAEEENVCTCARSDGTSCLGSIESRKQSKASFLWHKETMQQCLHRLRVHAGYFEADGSQTSHSNECQKKFHRRSTCGVDVGNNVRGDGWLGDIAVWLWKKENSVFEVCSLRFSKIWPPTLGPFMASELVWKIFSLFFLT